MKQGTVMLLSEHIEDLKVAVSKNSKTIKIMEGTILFLVVALASVIYLLAK